MNAWRSVSPASSRRSELVEHVEDPILASVMGAVLALDVAVLPGAASCDPASTLACATSCSTVPAMRQSHYWAWAILSSRWHRRYVSVPRWLFQERRLSLTLRLTFAVQRSCELEHFATTSQPSFVCLLLSKAHKVSPARAPSVSMTVSKKPPGSSAEQALASAAHMPTKDMLTASSVNNLFSCVPSSLSATGTFRSGVWTRMSPVGGSIIPGSDPGRNKSVANQWANAIGWDVLTRADTAAGTGVSTRADTAGG
jgi:hypothetical protein